MAIVALVLWAFTAGAGFYLLVTSNLARSRPATPAAPASIPCGGVPATPAAPASVPSGVPSGGLAQPASIARAVVGAPATPQAQAAPARQSASPAQVAPPPGPGSGIPASPRELKRAARARWDPPSLVAARQAPMLPALRSLLEFAHPTFGIIGLAFWLGFTLVHNKALGRIAFGLVAVTASLGLSWFTANLRAARQPGPDRGRGAPHFSGRLLVLHGSAAALTIILTAVTALVIRG